MRGGAALAVDAARRAQHRAAGHLRRMRSRRSTSRSGISRRGCWSLPLVTLLGLSRKRVPVYGSGGFTSYSNDRLAEQLAGWVAAGFGAVKMKIGRSRCGRPRPRPDRARRDRPDVRPVRRRERRLRTQAGAGARRCGSPSSASAGSKSRFRSDDLEGLRLLRDRAPAACEIAAGEYGYDARILPAHARGRRGRRAPGRRDPLSRHLRIPAGGRSGRRVPASHLRAHRAVGAPARLLRGRDRSPRSSGSTITPVSRPPCSTARPE